MREIKLETNSYYHVYNRGAGKNDIFRVQEDFLMFLKKIWEFNNKSTCKQRQYLKNIEQTRGSKESDSQAWESDSLPPRSASSPTLNNFIHGLPKLVDIICYNLIPNHYHLILKQLQDNGIRAFMHKLGTGYANYFNAKYKRTGFLFEQRFKAYPINDSAKLCWLSAYVNCNHEIHKLGKSGDWPFSSYQDYSGLRSGKLADKQIILKEFKNDINSYQKYCNQVIIEAQDMKAAIKKLLD